jgi:CHAT domain-containing protein
MFDDPVLQQLGARTIPYHEMLELIHLQLVNGDNDLYFEEALEVMENSRSAILNESLNRALTLSSSDVPEYKRKKERNLVRLRAELLQQINKVGENSDKRDSLNKVLINVSNQYNDLLNDLESVDRSKLVLRGNSGTASLEDVRSLTKQRDALLLEYFWADSSIYVLGISPSGKAFKKIAVTEELKSGLLSFQTSIANNPGEATRREEFGEFLKCSTALYKILVEPFLEMNPSVRTLIISADGALTNIPFEAMVSEMVDTAEVNYKLPYLINRYTLSYSYSTHTLLRQAKVPRQGGRLLAMAYGGRGEEDTLRSALGNLPGTETELRALQAVMPGGDNSYLFGSDATEANFKRLIPGFDIVHLAVHGLAERKNAYDSRLLFRSATDTVDDGALYAHELYDLDLRDLDLAVLSACESGVGTYQTGEGTRSIAHGFAYAGCPSLVMSLWKIDDRTTAGLVKDMYLELLDENEIDVVLMNIKKRYIENANEFKSHPYFWAALVQVGDSRPVEVGASLYRGWIIAAFLIGFLLLYALYRHYGRT